MNGKLADSSSVPSTQYVDGAVTSTLSTWASTFRGLAAIRRSLPLALPYRALYFGLFADNPTGGTWAAEVSVELRGPGGRNFKLSGQRGNASLLAPDPPNASGSVGSAGSLPSWSVRTFDRASHEWVEGPGLAGGVQWVEQIETDARIFVIDAAPFYVAGLFDEVVVTVGNVSTSLSGTESLSLFVGVKSSNLPIQ